MAGIPLLGPFSGTADCGAQLDEMDSSIGEADSVGANEGEGADVEAADSVSTVGV